MAVARKRVPGDDLEDMVQEAMGIVIQKGVEPGGRSVDSLPPIAWCFQVLRNVIGNYYQREATRRRRFEHSPAADPTTAPRLAEELDSEETLMLIEEVLEGMRSTDSQCGRYLSRLTQGAEPREIAVEENIEPAVFYKRLYRCRRKLRDALVERGVSL